VSIGTQIWLKENLKVTRYSNGDTISNAIDTTIWNHLTAGAYCDYKNTPDSSIIYGRLYNWYAVSDSRNVCPIEWHVSNDSDWLILSNFLGGDSIAAGKLKEIGTVHWLSPNNATNESGFTALPGGSRGSSGGFSFIHSVGSFWTSTEAIPAEYAFFWRMNNATKILNGGGYKKNTGFSARCTKDASSYKNEIINLKELNIFPNPATTTLTIEGLTQKTTAEVYDISGKLLLCKPLGTNTIDISSLETGLYFIKLTTADGSVVRKFVKE
jgi:uncharacterized protein (TIGR02145 family)